MGSVGTTRLVPRSGREYNRGETCPSFQERDTESGIDFFQARYASAPQGRFQSPDPAGMFVADPANPQSWNLYAYVMNNPLKYKDPTGMYCVGDGSGGFYDDDNGGQTCYDAFAPENNNFASATVNGSSSPVNYGSWSSDEGFGGIFGGGFDTFSFSITTTSTAISGAAGQRAPNNRTPSYKNACAQDALKTGVINAVIDAIGFIPEAGGVARMIGHQAGYVGVVADKIGSKLIKAVGKTAGVENSAVGFDRSDSTSWVSAAITVGDFMPVVNEFTTVAALSWDTGVAAYRVHQCRQ